jgi:hypothetical protein
MNRIDDSPQCSAVVRRKSQEKRLGNEEKGGRAVRDGIRGGEARSGEGMVPREGIIRDHRHDELLFVLSMMA